MALAAIINHFFYTQIQSHLKIPWCFLRKSGSFKWRASSWNLLHIWLFTIAVSKILVPLKVRAKTLTSFSLPRISLHPSMNLAHFPEELWNPCQFKPNMMECLWNIKKMWILKVSWESLIGYKEKLKLGPISGTMSACLSGQMARTSLGTRYKQHVPPPAEPGVWNKSIRN